MACMTPSVAVGEPEPVDRLAAPGVGGAEARDGDVLGSLPRRHGMLAAPQQLVADVRAHEAVDVVQFRQGRLGGCRERR